LCVSSPLITLFLTHFFKNTLLSEDIVIFTVKARLQVIPTTQEPHCLHHSSEQITETLPHILNGHHAYYKGMCTARHNRIVDLIVKDISSQFSSAVKMYKHSCVKSSMFQNCNVSETFPHVLANALDIVVMKRSARCPLWSLHVHLTLVWKKTL